jgi:hypothetical protein
MIGKRVMFGAAAVASAVVAAGGLSSAQGDSQQDATQPADAAVPGSEAVQSVSASDPRGGLPWRMRVHRTEAGRVCFTAGRVLMGRFGEISQAGDFNVAPLDGTAVCAYLTPPIDFSVLSGSSAPGAGDAVTVVTGIAAGGVRRVEVSALGQSVSQTPSGSGAFIAAFAGTVDKGSLPVVTATLADGQRKAFTIDE